MWTWCKSKLLNFESEKLQGRSWVLLDVKGIAFCGKCAELSLQVQTGTGVPTQAGATDPAPGPYSQHDGVFLATQGRDPSQSKRKL